MARPKARSDGLIERTRTISGKKMHFYGHTAKEVQAKIDAAVLEAAELREKGPLFEDVADAFWAEDVADAFWAEKEKKLKFESLMAHQ